VQGDLLRYSDPTWLKGLRRGITLIIWAVVIGIVGAFLGGLLRSALGPLPASFISLIAELMSVWGAWLLTEPDPSGLGERQYGAVRQVIRVTLLISVASQLLHLVKELSTMPPPAALLIQLVVVLAAIAGVVGQFAQLRYLSKLAFRIPDVKLAERAVFLMWAFGVSYGLLVVLGGLLTLSIALTGRSGGGLPMELIGCVALLLVIAVLIFGIMYLVMLARFGRAIELQSILAERIWRSDAPGATA
jgi:hypothetical protein